MASPDIKVDPSVYLQGKHKRTAVTSITKTPITFDDSYDQGAGDTEYNSLLAQHLQSLPFLSNMLRSVAPSQFTNITVNPNSPTNMGDIPSTIHHEEAHALLEPILNKLGIDQMQSFMPMARALSGKGGSPIAEAPAYAVERTSNIDSGAKDMFSKEFAQKLMQVDPQKGAIWNKLLNDYSGSGIE